MEIKDYTASENMTILDAMRLINTNGKGLIYLCEGKTLKGVVTDGNIRRHILSNGDLKAPVSEIANYKPKTIKHQEGINADKFMHEHTITSVPIINNRGEIITIKFRDSTPVYSSTNLNVPVVIMAGGKGTRLQPYTQVLPKPLIPIGDQTITELIISRFEEFGCNQFNLIINYKKNLIKAFFEESRALHNMTFTEESEFLGTGGGLKLIEGKYSSTFFMTNCDILIEDDYSELLKYHELNKNIITMVCATKDIVIPYGTITISKEGRVEKLNEKPNFSFMANTGLYVIEPGFLEYIPKNTFIHITDVIERCIAAGENVGMYPVSENAWMDMGQLSELEKMQSKYEKRNEG